MLRLAFDFIITWRETRTRPNAYYSVNITSIKNLGPGTPDTKPDPDENKAFLDVEFGVYPWIVRDQDADLE